MATLTRRLVNAPVPGHAAYGPGPAATQYGHIPQLNPKVDEVRAAARAGGDSLCY